MTLQQDLSPLSGGVFLDFISADLRKYVYFSLGPFVWTLYYLSCDLPHNSDLMKVRTGKEVLPLVVLNQLVGLKKIHRLHTALNIWYCHHNDRWKMSSGLVIHFVATLNWAWLGLVSKNDWLGSAKENSLALYIWYCHQEYSWKMSLGQI